MINTSSPGTSLPPLRRLLYGSLLSHIDRTVYGCEAIRSQWQRPGSSGWRRTGVIYNGVNTQLIDPVALVQSEAACRAQFGIPPERFVFGSVGRLSREKNQQVLIGALRAVRDAGIDAHLLLVGGGPLKSELEHFAAQAGVAGSITFTGTLSDVRPALKALDVFVLSSTWETFSNAALEAMAMRKPVILSDTGGSREMIDDGVEGHIIAPAQFSERLPSLLADLHTDVARRLRLGEASRARVQRQFSLDAMIDAHLALLDE